MGRVVEGGVEGMHLLEAILWNFTVNSRVAFIFFVIQRYPDTALCSMKMESTINLLCSNKPMYPSTVLCSIKIGSVIQH